MLYILLMSIARCKYIYTLRELSDEKPGCSCLVQPSSKVQFHMQQSVVRAQLSRAFQRPPSSILDSTDNINSILLFFVHKSTMIIKYYECKHIVGSILRKQKKRKHILSYELKLRWKNCCKPSLLQAKTVHYQFPLVMCQRFFFKEGT